MLLSSLFLSNVSHAGYAEGTPFSAGNTNTTPAPDAYGQVVRAFLNELLACERFPEQVCVVEERYLTIPIGGTDAMISADQLYKSNTGHVKGISCSSDATATAGTIALRDSTVAGAGNILWSQDILAIAYTPGMIREDLDTDFSVGLFLDFTTTADVKCMVRYR
jgi:hypothetical protein